MHVWGSANGLSESLAACEKSRKYSASKYCAKGMWVSGKDCYNSAETSEEWAESDRRAESFLSSGSSGEKVEFRFVSIAIRIYGLHCDSIFVDIFPHCEYLRSVTFWLSPYSRLFGMSGTVRSILPPSSLSCDGKGAQMQSCGCHWYIFRAATPLMGDSERRCFVFGGWKAEHRMLDDG